MCLGTFEDEVIRGPVDYIRRQVPEYGKREASTRSCLPVERPRQFACFNVVNVAQGHTLVPVAGRSYLLFLSCCVITVGTCLVNRHKKTGQELRQWSTSPETTAF